MTSRSKLLGAYALLVRALIHFIRVSSCDSIKHYVVDAHFDREDSP